MVGMTVSVGTGDGMTGTAVAAAAVFGMGSGDRGDVRTGSPVAEVAAGASGLPVQAMLTSAIISKASMAVGFAAHMISTAHSQQRWQRDIVKHHGAAISLRRW